MDHHLGTSILNSGYYSSGIFFTVYFLAGSFSRSAVNNESGARTGVTGIITGLVMTGALLFLTPIFEHVPEVLVAADMLFFVL